MIYFLYGDIPLQLKYEELYKKIKSENPQIVEQYFDISQDNIDDIFLALSSNSMFSPLTLITIKRLEKIKDVSKFIKSLGEFNYSQKIIILLYEEFLGDFGKATNEIDKTSLKNAEKIAEIIPARKALEKKSLEFYITKELSCSQYEAEKFLEIVGDDFYKIKNEIEKVKNFLNGEPFNLEKSIKILSVSNEYSLNKLIELFLYKKEKERLIEYLQREKNYMLFLSIFVEEISILAKLKNLQKRGIIFSNVSYNQFKADVYPNIKNLFKKDNFRFIAEYPLFLKLKYLDNFSYDFFNDKLLRCLDAEYNFKSGLVDENISIEMLINSFFEKKLD
ncbi:hypothetical protein [Fusobacterium sp.]|uniref:DNA polymerase III subunit delta n=1 Tax=Fusobacterium sp. TaxID=68766 RepID=UPI002607EA67|nr:hypothetical protein [Fusobacterium sp.]